MTLGAMHVVSSHTRSLTLEGVGRPRAGSHAPAFSTGKAVTNAAPSTPRQPGGMPEYAAEIEFVASEFAGAEFRMLARQLVPLLEDSDGVTSVRTDRSARSIRADVAVTAPSSSTATAKAGSLARALQAQTRKVRSDRIALRIEVAQRCRDGADDGPELAK